MFLIEFIQTHAFGLEHKIRAVVAAERVYSGVHALVFPPRTIDAQLSKLNRQDFKKLSGPRTSKRLRKAADIFLYALYGYCLFSAVRDWNSPVASGAILPSCLALLLARKVAKVSASTLLRWYPEMTFANKQRIVMVNVCVDKVISAVEVMLGAYFLVSGLPKVFAAQNAEGTLASLLGERIKVFDPADPRKKLLVLSHIDTTQFISGYAPSLKKWKEQFDVKFAVIRKNGEFAREVCAAGATGDVAGILLTVHGNENGIALDEDEIRKAVPCFKKIKHALFILNTCYGGTLKGQSPGARIARMTGLRVVANEGLSMWYPEFTSYDPLSVRFSDPFRPWRHSTAIFGGSQGNASSTDPHAMQAFRHYISALMTI